MWYVVEFSNFCAPAYMDFHASRAEFSTMVGDFFRIYLWVRYNRRILFSRWLSTSMNPRDPHAFFLVQGIDILCMHNTYDVSVVLPKSCFLPSPFKFDVPPKSGDFFSTLMHETSRSLCHTRLYRGFCIFYIIYRTIASSVSFSL